MCINTSAAKAGGGFCPMFYSISCTHSGYVSV